MLESLLIYLSLIVFDQNAAVIIGGYFAFKVASKWQSWHDIIQFPPKLEHVPDIDYFIARRRFGSILFVRFLLGTLTNVLIGFLAAAAIRAIR